MKLLIIILFTFATIASQPLGGSGQINKASTQIQSVQKDTIKQMSPQTDTSQLQKTQVKTTLADTVLQARVQKTTPPPKPPSDIKIGENKIAIVKREIDPKEYIAMAVGMMVFIALILTSVQTWNP